MWWVVATAAAGGFEVAQQGAVAGGTGHASVARDDDPAQAWFNPASLADGRGVRVGLGAVVATAAIDAEATDGSFATRTTNGLGTPPHLYASIAPGRWVAGLAVNTAFAGGVRWPADGPLRFESIESAPTFFRVAPFVGGRIRGVGLAFGAHVDAGELYIRKATDHVTDEGDVRVVLRGVGVGPDLSLYAQATDAWSFGVSYKGRTRLPLAGEVDFDVPDPFAAQLADGRATSTLRLPDRLAVGARLKHDDVRVLLDVTYTAWSLREATVIDFEDPATTDLNQADDWRDSLALRSGFELPVWRGLVGRAGGYVDGLPRPPAPATTLAPSSPDATRLAATVGLGFRLFEGVRVDTFGELLKLLERTSTSPDAPLATYRGVAFATGLSLSLKVPGG